jgi:hypothetical protein
MKSILNRPHPGRSLNFANITASYKACARSFALAETTFAGGAS